MARAYRRNKSGQFASNADSGARVTYGRAGGFASSSVRATKANNAAARRRKQALVRNGAKAVGTAAAIGVAGAAARRGVKNSPLGTVRKAIQAVRSN